MRLNTLRDSHAIFAVAVAACDVDGTGREAPAETPANTIHEENPNIVRVTAAASAKSGRPLGRNGPA